MYCITSLKKTNSCQICIANLNGTERLMWKGSTSIEHWNYFTLATDMITNWYSPNLSQYRNWKMISWPERTPCFCHLKRKIQMKISAFDLTYLDVDIWFALTIETIYLTSTRQLLHLMESKSSCLSNPWLGFHCPSCYLKADGSWWLDQIFVVADAFSF